MATLHFTCGKMAGADHVLHFVDTPDERCLVQLRRRNAERPEGSKTMTEDEFAAITALFVPPGPDEGFTVALHAPAAVSRTTRK